MDKDGFWAIVKGPMTRLPPPNSGTRERVPVENVTRRGAEKKQPLEKKWQAPAPKSSPQPRLRLRSSPLPPLWG
jgi:hypothetical protein